MHVNKIILLLLVVQSMLYSQRVEPFEPVEFPTLESDWYFYCKDTTISTFNNHPVFNFDGFNHIYSITDKKNLLLFDNKFYITFFYLGIGAPMFGCYLQCRDLLNGDLLWQNRIGGYSNENIEVIRLLSIDDDGNLMAISQRKPYHFSTPGAINNKYADMVLTTRIYNPENGNLIEHIIPQDTTSTFLTKYHFSMNILHSYFKNEEDGIRYIDFVSGLNGGTDGGIRTAILDGKTSHPISVVDTTQVYNRYQNFNLQIIGNDSIILPALDLENKKVYINYYTTRLEDISVSQIYFTTEFYPLGLTIVGISQDRKKILFSYLRSNTTIWTPEYLVVGVDGTIHKRIVLHDNIGRFYQILDWEKDDDYFTFLRSEVNGLDSNALQTSLVVMRYENEALEGVPIKTFETANPKRVAYPVFISTIDDNNFLIGFEEGAYYVNPLSGKYRLDQDAYAVSYMKVSKAALGLVSSTADGVQPTNKLVAYPNPTRDRLYIDGMEEDQLVSLYGMDGTKIMTTKYNAIDGIDVSSIRNGMYYIRVVGDHAIHATKLIKVN